MQTKIYEAKKAIQSIKHQLKDASLFLDVLNFLICDDELMDLSIIKKLAPFGSSKFGDSDVGKVRQCLCDIGEQHYEPEKLAIYNDKRKNGTRRLKLAWTVDDHRWDKWVDMLKLSFGDRFVETKNVPYYDYYKVTTVILKI